MKRKLALLCDYGLDDAIATVYLLNHSELFEAVDILPVAGNFPPKDTYTNAKRLLYRYGKAPVPVRIVNTLSLAQPFEKLADIHGGDGMGDVLPAYFEETVPEIDYDLWLSQVDDSYTVVSLGPCTVTLDILNKKGALPLVMMAGNISQPPNFKGYEFNHALDRPAFAGCVKYPHVTATLDSCHNPKCNLQDAVPGGRGILSDFLEKYIKLSKERKESACYVYDLTSAVYLVHPERFKIKTETDRDANAVNVLEYTGDIGILD